MRKKILSVTLLMTMIFAVTVFAGCKKNTEETEVTDQSTPAAATETAETETAAAETEPAFVVDYSAGFTDDGIMADIVAADYTEIPEADFLTFNLVDIELTDQEIDDLIDTMMQDNFSEASTEKEVEDGDTVNIDYVGSVDGVEFDGGNTQGQGTDVTIGVTSYIDDFLEQLIGHKPGETIDVNVTFPDPYPNNPDLAGKDALFVTTINHVMTVPELDDEFVAENAEKLNTYWTAEDISDVASLRQTIYDQGLDYNLESAIYEKLYSDAEVTEVPESVREIAKNQIACQLYSYYGMTWENYVEQSGLPEEEINAMLDSNAKLCLIYQAIVEQEGLSVTEDDIREYTGEETYDQAIDMYGRGYIAQHLLYADAMAYLKEIAVVK